MQRFALLLAFALAAVAVAGVVVVMQGTTASVSDRGPLGPGSARGGICIPVAADGTITDGFEALENLSAETVTLDAVRLRGAQQLQLTATWVVPPVRTADGITLLGLVPGTPQEPVWQQRRPAAGATLPPGGVLNLALQLRTDPAAPGTTDGFDVSYHDSDGRAFVWRSYWRLYFGPAGGVCDDPPGMRSDPGT